MSSPRKRIKLTPKKQKNYMEYTQESKVTSTPQRQNATVGSPNISTISSIRSSVKTSLFDTFNEDNLSESINAKAATSSSRSSSSLSVARSGKSEILAGN